MRCVKKRVSELNMCNVITRRLHQIDAQKRIRCESGAIPSLCMGAAFQKPLGDREGKSSDDRSQENCLGVEFQVCGIQNLHSHNYT